MGLTELIFRGPNPAEIGALILDASVRERHSASATATRHPIESDGEGLDEITDHIQRDPISLQIEGVVSNTPAESLSAIVDLFSGGGFDRVKQAHDLLWEDVLTGKLVKIVTTLKVYENMVLEKVDIVRDAKKGHALFFSAVATEIEIASLVEFEVETQQRPVPQSTKKAGKVDAKVANDSVQEKASLIKQGLNAFIPGLP